jgi:hypothetical protein
VTLLGDVLLERKCWDRRGLQAWKAKVGRRLYKLGRTPNVVPEVDVECHVSVSASRQINPYTVAGCSLPGLLILPYFLDPEGKVVVQVSLLGVNEIAIRLLLIIEPNQVHVSRRAGLLSLYAR